MLAALLLPHAHSAATARTARTQWAAEARGRRNLRGVREQSEPGRAQLRSEGARLEQVRQHSRHEAYLRRGEPERREFGQVAQQRHHGLG